MLFKTTRSNVIKVLEIKKKYFPYTVVGDLETTNGYISEIEGGSMFVQPFHKNFGLTLTTMIC